MIHAIPLIWKQKINDSKKSVEKSYVIQDQHLIKNTRVIVLDKLTAREIYSTVLLSLGNTPTSKKYFGKVFPNENFDWKKIYILPRVDTVISFQCHFQTVTFGFINGIENNIYKITNHILLIFKLHVCKSRERGTLELSRLINEIKKMKLLEKNSAKNHVRKLEQCNIKWENSQSNKDIFY